MNCVRGRSEREVREFGREKSERERERSIRERGRRHRARLLFVGAADEMSDGGRKRERERERESR